jgi:AcrR family transcriptional regulator
MAPLVATRRRKADRSSTPLAPVGAQPAPVDGRRRRGQATRAAILHEAVQLASTDGLGGLTMSALADRMGIPKSSVHAAFGSKEDLQVEVLRTTRAILIDHVVTPALSAPAGYERLVALGASWMKYLEAGVFEGGCVLSSSASELDGRPGLARDQLVVIMNEWLRFVADNVRAAIANGQFESTTDPDQLAFELHGIGLTANWHHQLFGGRAAFRYARHAWPDALARHRVFARKPVR